jgi:glutaredoxin
MSEPAVRLFVVGGVTVLAALVAGFAHLRARRRRVPEIDAEGFEGRIIFFTERSCPSCDTVRELLAPFEVAEYRYEDDPERLSGAGVDAVPVVVIRDEAGLVVDRIAGVPSIRRLAAGMRRAGITKSSYPR